MFPRDRFGINSVVVSRGSTTEYSKAFSGRWACGCWACRNHHRTFPYSGHFDRLSVR